MASQSLNWNWNDGGRFSSGFVGLTGDCVTRAIAIATGENYRHVYKELGDATARSPRFGVNTVVADAYLRPRGWTYQTIPSCLLHDAPLPGGVTIVRLDSERIGRPGHLCTVINQVVHDTWDPTADNELNCVGFWTNPQADQQLQAGLHPASVASAAGDGDSVLTQQEFDRILHRLRSLDNTAKNGGSTEGEKRNAIRMMQNLMLRHNLTRQDLVADQDSGQLSFTNLTCPVNGRRALEWEKNLAAYVTAMIFPMTGWYYQSSGHRTLFCFYGPLKDVENCLLLFRELLVAIAAAARLQYGGFSRGSGASYCEGYVAGLPRDDQAGSDSASAATGDPTGQPLPVNERAMIQARVLALRKTLREWLKVECGIELVYSRGRGRSERDPEAEARGNRHGAQHRVESPGGPKRIEHHR